LKQQPKLICSILSLGPPMEHIKEIGRALRCIADELDQDQRIQRSVQKGKRAGFFSIFFC